jgi:hypothetical protein
LERRKEEMISKKYGLWAILIMVSFGLLLTASCGGKKTEEERAAKSVESLIKNATGKKADVDLQKGKLKFETDEGSAELREENEWPSDLPGEVPEFGGATVKGVMRTKTEQGQEWNIMLGNITQETMRDYVEKLKETGWEIGMESTMGDGAMIQAQKDDLFLIAGYSKKEGGGSIHVGAKRQ